MSVWHQTQCQEILEHAVHKIFPQCNIRTNSKKEHGAKDTHTAQYLEVDVWVPELKLCFEYQDYYHYTDAWYCNKPLSIVLERDNIKRVKLLGKHQTLIIVPFWWNGDVASLQATIHFHRPDLRVSTCTMEIAFNLPTQYLEDISTQLMLASFAQSNVVEKSSWWVGEKWDGIRCFWDTTTKKLYSRNNLVINFQTAIGLTRELVLDAELWCGRGFFTESIALMAKSFLGNTLPFNGSLARLICFDEASPYARTQPFEDRYSVLVSHLPSDHQVVTLAPRFLCNSEQTLQESLQAITEAGGEGVMLRQPLSHYIAGRSDFLFKIKASYTDQEALVVKVENDASLLLQLQNGSTFTVERKDITLPQQAVKGDVVTFRNDPTKRNWRNYQNDLEQDCLMDCTAQPEVYRIRSDLVWEDVISGNNHIINFQTPLRYVGRYSDLPTNFAPKDHAPKRASRSYFDKFAATKGMDSLNPHFWYSVIPSDLVRFGKEHNVIAFNYESKLYEVLSHVYPDIGLQQCLFEGGNRWKYERARRDFFNNFAASKGGDPLNPNFWYSVTPLEIKKYSNSYVSIKQYGGNLRTILMQLYPDIGLDHKKFKERQRWIHEESRRDFFDKFAAAKGGDPLSAKFWYSVKPLELKQYDNGYRTITNYHGGSMESTIKQLYPNITLKPKLKSRFKSKPHLTKPKHEENTAQRRMKM